MLKRLLVLVLILLPSANTVLADEPGYSIRDCGNVKVRIETGFEYEEINKVAIIGELARRLTKNLGYRETVFLDFEHFYTRDCDADYFVSFDDGADPEVLTWTPPTSRKPEPFLKSPALVIRQVSRSFDVATTLKLVEYAVSHVAEIKRDQQLRIHKDRYDHWQALSIDKDKITKIIAAPISPTIEEVWREPTFRPGTERSMSSGLSYYFAGGKFVVYSWRYDLEKPLLSLEDIYDFQKVLGSQALVYDTDESFYYVANRYRMRSCSKRHVIEDTHDYHRPYETQSLGHDKIAICFSYRVPGQPADKRSPIPRRKQRVLIYRPEQDDLVQDLDELLDNR